MGFYFIYIYLYLETYYSSYDKAFRVKIPFNRYYASEKNAPKIESVVWNMERDEAANVYAKVRILNGKAAIEDLYVDNIPIEKYIQKNLNDINSEQ